MSLSIKAVVFNHNQRKTAEPLFLALREHFDAALFDSGSDESEVSDLSTHRFENLFWTNCWNKSWELFGDYDVIWGIGGDCQLLSAPEAFKESIQSLYPFGLWSPLVKGQAEEYMQVPSEEIYVVKKIEGVAFAISKALWSEAGPFDKSNYIGYGHDLLHSIVSLKKGMRNIIDARVSLSHPPSRQYNKDLAKLLMAAGIRKRLGDDVEWQRFFVKLSGELAWSSNTISKFSSLDQFWAAHGNNDASLITPGVNSD